MRTVAIIGNGPNNHIPNLKAYTNDVNVWIGADGGALTLIKNGITPDYAVGDFDSIDKSDKSEIHNYAPHVLTYPTEKNETDLELAISEAIKLKPSKIYLFGVTGGRLDHALINIQLLSQIVQHDIQGIIIDKWNQIELTEPGTHSIYQTKDYPYISFVPLTNVVSNLTLADFLYPLTNFKLQYGSTRCISNKLLEKVGTYSYDSGSLLVIKSNDPS